MLQNVKKLVWYAAKEYEKDELMVCDVQSRKDKLLILFTVFALKDGANSLRLQPSNCIAFPT